LLISGVLASGSSGEPQGKCIGCCWWPSKHGSDGDIPPSELCPTCENCVPFVADDHPSCPEDSSGTVCTGDLYEDAANMTTAAATTAASTAAPVTPGLPLTPKPVTTPKPLPTIAAPTLKPTPVTAPKPLPLPVAPAPKPAAKPGLAAKPTPKPSPAPVVEDDAGNTGLEKLKPSRLYGFGEWFEESPSTLTALCAVAGASAFGVVGFSVLVLRRWRSAPPVGSQRLASILAEE
jgi:hypothetical protein